MDTQEDKTEGRCLLALAYFCKRSKEHKAGDYTSGPARADGRLRGVWVVRVGECLRG